MPEPRCLVCGEPLEAPATGGRTPKFCSPRHRAQYHRQQQAKDSGSAPARGARDRPTRPPQPETSPAGTAAAAETAATNAPTVTHPAPAAVVREPTATASEDGPAAVVPAKAAPPEAEPAARTPAAADPLSSIVTTAATHAAAPGPVDTADSHEEASTNVAGRFDEATPDISPPALPAEHTQAIQDADDATVAYTDTPAEPLVETSVYAEPLVRRPEVPVSEPVRARAVPDIQVATARPPVGPGPTYREPVALPAEAATTALFGPPADRANDRHADAPSYAAAPYPYEEEAAYEEEPAHAAAPPAPDARDQLLRADLDRRALESALQVAQATAAHLAGEVADLRAQLATAAAGRARAEQDLNATLDQLDELTDRSSRELGRADEVEAQWLAEATSLEQEVRAALADTARLRAELATAQEEARVERGDADRLYAEAQSARADAIRLQEELRAERHTVASLLPQVEAAQQETQVEREDADRLYADLLPARDEIARLAAELREALVTIAALEDNRRAERTRSDLLKTEIAAQRGLRERSEAERDRLLDELERLLENPSVARRDRR